MTKKSRKSIKTLDGIIEICIYWKKQIVEKTDEGKKLLEEFEEEDILDVLSDMI